ncbi:MAG: hypothetical protein RPR40_03765 [Bermanella sp.]|jgi:hypothetical protein
MKIIFLVIAAMLLAGCASGFEGVRAAQALFSGTLSDYLETALVAAIQANPHYTLIVGGISAAMPAIAWVANRTSNPIDNAFLIALNKLLQTLTGNTAHNQPTVLSLKQMLTNKPSAWPALLRAKMSVAGEDLIVSSIQINV